MEGLDFIGLVQAGFMKNHSNTGSYSAGCAVTGVAHLGLSSAGLIPKSQHWMGSVTWPRVMFPDIAPEAVHPKRGAHKGWLCL